MLAWLPGRYSHEAQAPVALDEPLLARFRRLIANTTGIDVIGEPKGLQAIVAERIRRLGITHPQTYFDLLEGRSAAGEVEWSELATLITNGESHFFRDLGQIALLRDEILPELIKRNRDSRTLRIWCAGCSTGEEPYSVAILVNELLPAARDWNIMILGSDINPMALARARRGLYGPWSFRTVDAGLKERYFRNRDGQWELRADIRSMVTFRAANINAGRPAEVNAAESCDLIICRNVFIYFDRGVVAGVIASFAGTLRKGGYLLTGHGELGGHDLRGLHTRRFPGSLIYQRPDTDQAAPRPDTSAAANTTLTLPVTPRTQHRLITFKRVPPKGRPGGGSTQPRQPAGVVPLVVGSEADALQALADAGQYDAAIERGQAALRDGRRDARILSILALVYANRGWYDLAAEHCREAVAMSPLAVDPHYILAHIAEERGDIEEAKKSFRHVLHLAPTSVAAYLHLADIHEREGAADRARTMRDGALALLLQMEPAHAIPHYGESNVRELTGHLCRMLGRVAPPAAGSTRH